MKSKSTNITPAQRIQYGRHMVDLGSADRVRELRTFADRIARDPTQVHHAAVIRHLAESKSLVGEMGLLMIADAERDMKAEQTDTAWQSWQGPKVPRET